MSGAVLNSHILTRLLTSGKEDIKRMSLLKEDISSTACELTMSISSISVTFNVTCLTVAPLTRKTFCLTRSLSNAAFSFLITSRSSSSKSAAMYKISSKLDDFSLRYGDMAAIHHLELFYYHTRPPTKSLLLTCQISCQSDPQI